MLGVVCAKDGGAMTSDTQVEIDARSVSLCFAADTDTDTDTDIRVLDMSTSDVASDMGQCGRTISEVFLEHKEEWYKNTFAARSSPHYIQ